MSLEILKTMLSLVSPEPPLLSLGWMFMMVSRTSCAMLLWNLEGSSETASDYSH